MDPAPTARRKAYRSVFISDIHLGSTRSQAEKLLSFLQSHDMEQLYLVGDVVDGWRFAKFGHWPETHSEVLNSIFAKANNGVKVTFTPGNHDHLFRAYLGRTVKGVKLVHDLIHETADGKKFWVVHGDSFDKTAYVPDWIIQIADFANRGLHFVNDAYNGLRKKLKLAPRCLVHYLKNTSKHGEEFKKKFARLISAATAEKGADGVICGHIHKPEKKSLSGVTYFNTGDWVESCSALVEHPSGRLEIIRW